MYKPHSVWVALACSLALGLGAGCSKSKPPPPKPTPPAPPKAAPAATTAPAQPAPPATQPVHATPAAPIPGVPPLRLTAVFGDGEKATAGLTDMRNGQELVARVGDTVAGYRIAAIDADAGTVQVEKDGVTRTLKLDSADLPVPPPPPIPLVVAPTGAAAQAPMPLPAPTEHFEATPAERARGIDPNDAKTWPADYKGPSIERALQGAQAGRKADAEPEPAPMGVDVPAVEPTEQEKAKGIDPNDPATWPADYKGPAIEDAQAEQAQGAAAAGPALPAATFEPTADERARGIDPNDAKTWPADYKGPTLERALKDTKAAKP